MGAIKKENYVLHWNAWKLQHNNFGVSVWLWLGCIGWKRPVHTIDWTAANFFRPTARRRRPNLTSAAADTIKFGAQLYMAQLCLGKTVSISTGETYQQQQNVWSKVSWKDGLYEENNGAILVFSNIVGLCFVESVNEKCPILHQKVYKAILKKLNVENFGLVDKSVIRAFDYDALTTSRNLRSLWVRWLKGSSASVISKHFERINQRQQVL